MPPDTTKTAIEVILKEHKKILDGDVKTDELTRAKEMIKGRFLLSLEDSFEVANYYGEKLLLEGETTHPEDYIKSLEKVNMDDVMEIAKETFKAENLNLALIGPVKESKEIENLLTI